MPRNFPPSFQTNISNPIVFMATCLKITLKNGTAFGLTNNVDPIVVGGATYYPDDAFLPSAAEIKSGTGADVFEIVAILAGGRVTAADITNGLYDGATIREFCVNPLDLSNPTPDILSGFIGRIIVQDGLYRAEFRSLSQVLQQIFGDATSGTCRYIFGDSNCTFDITTVQFDRTVTAINSSVAGIAATPLLQQNAGGGAVSPYTADAGYSGGGSGFIVGTGTLSTSHSIGTSGVTDPAPQGVYQTCRTIPFSSNLNYTFSGYTPGQAYNCRLHFAEIFYTGIDGAGQRNFNVTCNGDLIVNHLDVYAVAGGPYIAVVIEAIVVADNSGVLLFVFSPNNEAGGAFVSGIQIITLAVPAIAGNGITFGSDTNPTGFYLNGIMKCLTGLNSGLSIGVKQHQLNSGSAVLVTQLSFPYAVLPGDTFQLTAGCDKQWSTCKFKWANWLNYGGEQNLPTNDLLLEQGR